MKKRGKQSFQVHNAVDFSGGSDGKESTCQCRRLRFDSWVRKIPWRRKWQPTPVFLPGESHGPRSLVGYSPWGRRESDTTEHAHRRPRKVAALSRIQTFNLFF
ncbi:unnamed protein product [Rangifer tarandus platyrhynchus]|uniref:Uncharacterized protein n=2 Tax=Rangifer tarandus platyrhynchus TaxID=3082113 RepID=A0ACB1KHI9_RANTA|nr:unnamed protein product [Rangifer tarandus platyrhynchus]